MRCFSYILIISFAISGIVKAQNAYQQMDHTNYRDSEAFNQTINTNAFNAETLNACIFFATNEIRAKKKLPLVSYHQLLEQAAMLHSKDMTELDFFSHTNPKVKEHRETSDRANKVGIETPYIAENIIEGFILEYEANSKVYPEGSGIFSDPKTGENIKTRTYLELSDNLLSLWMKSEGHKENILSKDALQLGCGSAIYFMPDFNNMPMVKATQCFQWFEEIPE